MGTSRARLSPGNRIHILDSTTTSCRNSLSYSLLSLPASPSPFFCTPKQCSNCHAINLSWDISLPFSLSKIGHHFSSSASSPSDVRAPVSGDQGQPHSLRKNSLSRVLALHCQVPAPLPPLRVTNLVLSDSEAPGYVRFYFTFAHCSQSFPKT